MISRDLASNKCFILYHFIVLTGVGWVGGGVRLVNKQKTDKLLNSTFAFVMCVCFDLIFRFSFCNSVFGMCGMHRSIYSYLYTH